MYGVIFTVFVLGIFFNSSFAMKLGKMDALEEVNPSHDNDDDVLNNLGLGGIHESSLLKSFSYFNHADLSSTIGTLNSFLLNVRETRQTPVFIQYKNMGELQNQLMHLSVLNQHLLAQANKDQVPVVGNRSLAVENVILHTPSIPKHTARTIGGDCGGSPALGIFNFLTFLVYAFSLLVALLQLASGSMANAFLPNILEILQNGRRKRDLEESWNSILESLNVSKLEKSLGSMPRSKLERNRRDLEVNMGSGLMMALLEATGVQADGAECTSPLSSVFVRKTISKTMHMISKT